MTQSSTSPRPKAVLVGLHLPTVSLEDHQASLAELGRLATTLGFEVITTLSQRRTRGDISTIVGEGKLKELARLTGGTGIVPSQAPLSKKDKDEAPIEEEEEELDDEATAASVRGKAEKVIFDDELSPTQLRNLEAATGVEVLDRAGVIIEIFHRHAKTREARIQVEIARLKYLTPRLRVSRAGQDRQGGGIGAKGIGETAHELDKRRIRDRIAELNRELETIHDDQMQRRQRRKEQAKVALVGYTNAGKSSLMRALTGSQVLVEDKLFATLDTTVRALYPETIPRILVSDTVGFIKKLPHDLVASFRSTLDEAQDASLLLYVVDASDPTFRAQLEVTRTVLSELHLDEAESRLVLNKCDQLSEFEVKALLKEFPEAIPLSAHRKDDVTSLHDLILGFFEREMVEEELFIPYSHGHLIGEIHTSMRVLKQHHDEEGTYLNVRTTEALIKKVKAAL